MNDSPTLESELVDWALHLPAASLWQRTLAAATPPLRGREPHSGHPVVLRFLPAPPDTGVVYTSDRAFALQPGRVRPNPRQSCQARVDTVMSTDICLSLVCGTDVKNGTGNGHHRSFLARRPRTRISHIEHLSAVLYALGVDNAYVHVEKDTYARDLFDKRAIPILGSCTLGFARAVAAAGIVEQGGAARQARTLRHAYDSVHPEKGDRIRAQPLADPTAPLEVHYQAGYSSLGVEDCELDLVLTPEQFLSRVGGARTMLGQLNAVPLILGRLFGMFAFPSYGVGLGVNTGNTLAPIRGRVIGDIRFGSPGQELVRHKIVDFLGAVALLGPLSGIRFEVTKSGHANDLRVLRELDEHLTAVP